MCVIERVLRELCLISFHPDLNIKALPTQQISIRSVQSCRGGCER